VGADLLVLEEKIGPADGTAELSEKLEIVTDAEGFFQGDNVHNLPIFTNRTGIFVVGSGKGPVSAAEAEEEVQAAALEVYQLLGDGKPRVAEGRILLDRRKCAICLTCYRLCPHRAISILDRRPYFDDLACRACGICAAECPMDAIQLQRFTDGHMEAQWLDLGGPGRIVAFCCENSAHEAARLAAFRGFQLPEGFRLIRVPCAGKVDEDYILSALASGAEAVMVMACHHESCKSVHGSHLAEARVEHMKEALEEMGVERGRLTFVNLAPASAFDFIRAVQRVTHDLALRESHGGSLEPSEGALLFAKEGPGEIS
jgi:coenzyme F420-reducing hydrogenase delta subunit/Pyruvate/2-oxoacid:ferredoxin oxidoreductase delta subunit